MSLIYHKKILFKVENLKKLCLNFTIEVKSIYMIFSSVSILKNHGKLFKIGTEKRSKLINLFFNGKRDIKGEDI